MFIWSSGFCLSAQLDLHLFQLVKLMWTLSSKKPLKYLYHHQIHQQNATCFMSVIQLGGKETLLAPKFARKIHYVAQWENYSERVKQIQFANKVFCTLAELRLIDFRKWEKMFDNFCSVILLWGGRSQSKTLTGINGFSSDTRMEHLSW